MNKQQEQNQQNICPLCQRAVESPTITETCHLDVPGKDSLATCIHPRELKMLLDLQDGVISISDCPKSFEDPCMHCQHNLVTVEFLCASCGNSF